MEIGRRVRIVFLLSRVFISEFAIRADSQHIIFINLLFRRIYGHNLEQNACFEGI